MDSINPLNKTSDFKEGDRVQFVPAHLAFDFFMAENPKEIGEQGVVKSLNEKFVFVNYIRNGILQSTAEATNPRDLIK